MRLEGAETKETLNCPRRLETKEDGQLIKNGHFVLGIAAGCHSVP